MTDDPHVLLKKYFGFDTFRPGQEEVIGHLLAGQSAAAVFPTGGGKSICYQLPALQLPGLTLVVSPLIALMKDQIDALHVRGIAAARLDSTLDVGQYREVMSQLRSNALRLLYVAPERFNNERFREMLQRLEISLFAVDEAHCISEWGHNFRPDYLKLAEFARRCRADRVLALTATATKPVLEDICRNLEITPECAVRTGFYRPNLQLEAIPVSAAERTQRLLAGLRESPPGPTIIYVSLQHTAEEVAAALQQQGLPARAYHAGMKNELRSQVQDEFMASQQGIVVATIAFGMGVDKANIRYVVHFNLPKSLENYSQEIGRAGRDGEPSCCRMLVCPDDLTVLENFIYGDTPEPAAVRSFIQELFSQGPELSLNLYDLSYRHDIRKLVLSTLLTYLELDGFLEGGTPLYSEYKFKPLMSSQQILAGFEGDRKAFLAGIFRQARKARLWFEIDPARTAEVLGSDRLRVVRALDWLGDQGMLEVQAGGVRQQYRRLRQPTDLIALADELHQRSLQRETAEIQRLDQVVQLVGLDGCHTAALAAHFDEQLEAPCGHCGWCVGGKIEVPQRQHPEIPEELWSQVAAAVQAHPGVLNGHRCLTRFLCDISSPRLSRARLGKQPSAGALVGMPFKEVLAWVEGHASGE